VCIQKGETTVQKSKVTKQKRQTCKICRAPFVSADVLALHLVNGVCLDALEMIRGDFRVGDNGCWELRKTPETAASTTIAASVPITTSDPTFVAYEEMRVAFRHYNETLFEKRLPDCLITLSKLRRGVSGHYARSRFVRLDDSGTHTDEIALNPQHFRERDLARVLQTLVHEMVHGWQNHFGTPSRRGYHNKEWGLKMKAIGLYPSSTGAPGGAETGQRMGDYPIVGGPYERVTAALLADGFTLTWALPAEGEKQSGGKRCKYVCPACGLAAWAKSDAELTCTKCAAPMLAENGAAMQPVARLRVHSNTMNMHDA
jgi:hypothetical protein